jgi:hypothetical protein
MQDSSGAGAVLYAKDIQRVSRFYSQVAGLPIVHEEKGLVILQSPRFQLVVVATPPAIAAQITIASPPVRREDVAVNYGFQSRAFPRLAPWPRSWAGR